MREMNPTIKMNTQLSIIYYIDDTMINYFISGYCNTIYLNLPGIQSVTDVQNELIKVQKLLCNCIAFLLKYSNSSDEIVVMMKIKK